MHWQEFATRRLEEFFREPVSRETLRALVCQYGGFDAVEVSESLDAFIEHLESSGKIQRARNRRGVFTLGRPGLPEDWRVYLASCLREVFSTWRSSEGVLADLTGVGLYTPGSISIRSVRMFLLDRVASGDLKSKGIRVGERASLRYAYARKQQS